MLLSFNLLRRIEVKECSSMEQVVREEEGEEDAMTHKFTFPALFSITIESCSNLTNFHLGSRALEFPKLGEIIIGECPKMSAFSSSVSRESGDASDENVVGIYDNTTTFFGTKVSLVFNIYGHNLFHIFLLFDQHECVCSIYTYILVLMSRATRRQI